MQRAGCGDNSLRVMDLMHREHRQALSWSLLSGLLRYLVKPILDLNIPQLLRWFINFIIGFSKNHITSAPDGAVPLHMRSTLLGSIDLRMTHPVACGAEAMLFSGLERASYRCDQPGSSWHGSLGVWQLRGP